MVAPPTPLKTLVARVEHIASDQRANWFMHLMVLFMILMMCVLYSHIAHGMFNLHAGLRGRVNHLEDVVKNYTRVVVGDNSTI
jgi:hypothetical protein